MCCMTLAGGRTSLIQQVYADLDLVGENLIDVPVDPYEPSQDGRWAALGEWLLLARRVNADKVFFVNDDPVLVFSTLPDNAIEKDIMECYRRTWSLARPRCLFLEIGDELRVYSLSDPPHREDLQQSPITPLAVVNKTANVLQELTHLRRDLLESGIAFENTDRLKPTKRADQQLLKDVRSAASALIHAGLEPTIAHSLIERVVLVRYLEDRKIITEDYFESVIARNKNVDDPLELEIFQQPNYGQPSRFISFLNSKRAIYILFDQLAEDFNGDLFVTNSIEREIVTVEHLRLLMGLLQGTTTVGQEPLFFWAYDFSVIPTNLISTMYEIFHQEESGGDHSNTHFTPPELVEFVLDDTLAPSILANEPIVCDPACGSGVFLVEAYRRIVRHEMSRTGERLSNARLQELLLNRIVGCDINEAAIRLAAFSLYIVFLNYQTPQDIINAGPLPRLINRDESCLVTAPLIVSDAFSPALDRSDQNAIEPGPDCDDRLTWKSRGFDVVVGNPPWSQIRGPTTRSEQWAVGKQIPVGDRSPSQLFMWRALDILAEGGVAGLLVSAKAMFNKRSTSIAFRRRWLRSVALQRVVNFSQIRTDFFASAISPFMMLRFRNEGFDLDGMVVYETARPVAGARRGSSALARLDRQVVSQRSLLDRDYLWKTYSSGSFRDEAFLARLELEGRLCEWTLKDQSAFGYQRARHESDGMPPSEFLRNLPSLTKLPPCGPIGEDAFEQVPELVKRVPDNRIFEGRRLLVKLGVTSGFGPISRLVSRTFAFRHTIYGLSMDHLQSWQSEVIQGTLLSSLGRYWLYMHSGSWGAWHDEVRKTDLLNLPIRLTTESDEATRRIRRAIEELDSTPAPHDAMGRRNLAMLPQFVAIDEAVASLFRLSDPERYLVTDFWDGQKPDATSAIPDIKKTQGRSDELDLLDQDGIAPYLKVFLGAWNRRLGDAGTFGWRIWRSLDSNVIAAVFETRANGEKTETAQLDSEFEDWMSALCRIGVAWDTSRSRSILTYGLVRAVTDTAIVIVKRDEKRLWTPSAAWQDADATAAQVMSLSSK